MRKYSSVALSCVLAALSVTSFANADENCTRYDTLNMRAQLVLTKNSTCDSIDPELFGLRKKLYDYGIGFEWNPSMGYDYDVLGHNEKTSYYNGQDPNFDTSLAGATLTADLGSYGMPGNAQLTVQAGSYHSTTDDSVSGIPKFFSMTMLNITQDFDDGQVLIEYGYSPLIYNFYGTVLGGNTSSAALGPSSVIPYQVGVSVYDPTPSFTLRLRDNDTHLYNTFAVTRSTSPDGEVREFDRNQNGFRITMKGSKPLLMDEIGYKTDASETSHSVWLRLGGIYNFSRYTSSWNTTSDKNYAAYAAATVQLTQPTGTARGWYADVKLDYAPPKVNLYSSDVQLTMFYEGCFGRPDMFSVAFTKNILSVSGVRTLRAQSLNGVAGQSYAASVSYAMHVSRGIFFSPSLTYTRNPSIVPRRKNSLALNLSMNANI